MSINAALNLGTGTSYADDTHAWHSTGRKSRNGGYNAEYTVCSDEYDPDDVDHAEQVAALGDGDDWPDEFHHPGKLQIRIDPGARIEFIYTPQIETAKARHESRATVTHGDRESVYDNHSLSIRLDLDHSAPYGIALDIGRSAYDGGKNGRHLTRDADLLGGVFESIEAQGSHEYTGFDESSAALFRDFAERFALQLYLQQKNIRAFKLGKAAALKAA